MKKINNLAVIVWNGRDRSIRLRIIGVVLMIWVFLPMQITAAPPQTINYQGYLTDNLGVAKNGTFAMVFSIYNVSTAGVALWTETQATVTVANGLYSVVLGSVTPINLPFDVPYFLGIKVSTDAEMTPRTTLASVPYAFNAASTPPGMISAYGGATAPTGYLLCQGQAVSRTTYAALFAVIGTTFGAGDGTTTFNLPDLRGIFARGAGTNGTLLKANGGTMTGGSVGLLANDKMQGHWHTGKNGFLNAGTAGTLYEINNAYTINGGNIGITSPITDGTNGTPRTGDETAPASLSVNYIIKY
ncbi:MAG: phage tail protein [Spirochaetia bacterium]|nr:phage tail protein [Spirochaetia bacterium]